MKKNILILIVLLQMTAFVKAQSFEYVYSTLDDEQVWDAAEDTAGNYYLVGYRDSNYFYAYSHHALIIKLNPNGDTIKTAIIPHSSTSIGELNYIINLTDTTFAGIGIATDSGVTFKKIWYVKFDTNLNILDEKKYGNAVMGSYTLHARKSHKNEILITGFAFHATYDILFYRLSLDGDSLQSFLLGDSLHFETADDVLDLPDSSGYLFFGHTHQLIQNPSQIIKTNTYGIIDTVYTIPFWDGIESISAIWLSDTTFAMERAGGNGNPYFGLSYSLFDLNFNLHSDTLLGYFGGIDKPCFKGMDVVISNSIYGTGTINWDGFLFEPHPAFYNAIKFNNNMQVQWNKIISHGSDYLNLWGVTATQDGGVLLTGTRYNYLTSGPNERDIYVVKLDSLGNFATGINNPTTTTQVHDVIVYPNPVTDMLNIRSTLSFPATEITLYDAAGRAVLENKFFKSTSTSIKHLKTGIYFYKIKDTKGKEVRGKIIKE